MDKHQAEIDKGRVVRGYVCEDDSHRSGWNGGFEVMREKNGMFTEPILLILPPKPLEIEGWVCDAKARKNKNCVARHNEIDANDCCLSASRSVGRALMEEVNCRKVVLVEKEK